MRKEYTGGAPPTELTTAITAGSTTFDVLDATGYPTGTTAPFVVVIARGTAAEEKILVTSRSGNTFTIDQRGYDDTPVFDHAAGESVVHTLDAASLTDLSERVYEDGRYTIAVIPDTQYLSQDYPAHFTALADFIANNKDDLGIELVLHVGDVVQIGNTTQYDTASAPMNTLYGLGVPFLACIGNHDYDNTTSSGAVDDTRPTTNWNAYFGPDKYTGQSWFDGEFYDPAASENFYCRMTLGGRSTIVLVLEFAPRQAVMNWAQGVIEGNPFDDIIVLTHSYVDAAGDLVAGTSTNDPSEYSITDYTDGYTMWQNYLSQSPNVVATFNGHHLGGNLAVKHDYNGMGTLVHQQFNNWQNATEGGQGRIVFMTVDTNTGTVQRRVYNSALGQYDTAKGNEEFYTWFTRDAEQYQLKLESRNNIIFHFDATQIAGLTSGTGISTIEDISGNAYHADAVQTALATYQTGVLNGNPVARFAGDAGYRYPNEAGISFAQPNHVFMIVKRTGTISRQYVFDGQNVTGNPRNLFALNYTGGVMAMWSNVWLQGPATDTAFHKIELIFNSTDSVIIVDDVEVARGDAGPNIFSPIQIGSTSISPHTGDFLDGDLAELRIYGNILSDTEKATVNSELLSKWGL